MKPDPTEYRERLAAEAASIRDSGSLGRSEPLIRLFDFLLERSLAGRIPKEIEIAQEVFNKTTDFDMMLDASVRVYIHRLRRKLEEHYRAAPLAANRISIPLGEYHLVLAEPGIAAPEPAPVPDQPGVAAPEPNRKKRRAWISVAVVGLLAVNAATWVYFIDRLPSEVRPVLNKLWQPLAQNKRPTAIALGDYYIFGDAGDGITVSRLVRDFSINSREELDAHLMSHPEEMGRYIDLNLHYLPTASGPALGSLLPIIDAAAASTGIRPRIATISTLEADLFKTVNVVYVGFLSGLGPLQAPLFRASGFKIGANYDELIDKASGRHFKSDWGLVADGKVPQRDYGYLASLPGPAGNRIIIVAGTRDAAVAQMAEVSVDKQQLDTIDARSGGGAFEALFEVRTLGNLNLGSSLVLVRPIHADKIWQPDRSGE